MVTKKHIIKLLWDRQGQASTIAFGGLVTVKAVDEANDATESEIRKQINNFNIMHPKLAVSYKRTKVSIQISNNQSIMLIKHPMSGGLQVRSKDYIIGGCFCDFKDIMAKTFKQTKGTIAFQTRAGNTILLSSS